MADTGTAFSTIKHPTYASNESKWQKYRDVLESGATFVNKYLQKYSTREDSAEFEIRRRMSYCPAFAKAGLIDIRNSIYQRTSDIRRTGGGSSYIKAVAGLDGGVDLCGNSMDGFIGRTVLTELLGMGKVAVFVDKPPVEEGATLATTSKIRPYLYLYTAEEVKSWTLDADNTLNRILLSTTIDTIDETTGLVSGTTTGHTFLYKDGGRVKVERYDSEDDLISEHYLNLPMIPVAVFSLTNSVLEDAADYQVALLNMESSDIHYLLKANFPFYVEQFAPLFDMTNNQGQGVEKSPEIGPTKGRRYPAGLNKPEFIAPPTEPIKASMEKEELIKADIRRIINLNVSSMTSSRASGESKGFDLQGLEAGLAYIGTELQYGETQIARIWAAYEGVKEPAVVQYPTRYTLTSLDERLDMAKKVREEMPMVPSKTYQKEMAKEVATQLVGSKISADVLNMIHAEIDNSDIIVTDPDILKQDHEAGFVSTATASKARGYAKDEWVQAGKDHAERAARIVMAQTAARDATAAGGDDVGNDPQAGKKEKQASQSADGNINAERGVRS